MQKLNAKGIATIHHVSSEKIKKENISQTSYLKIGNKTI